MLLIWTSPAASGRLKLVATGFAALVVFFFVGVAALGSKTDLSTPRLRPTEPETTAAAVPAAPTPATPTARPQPTAKPQPKLNEPFRLGDFTYAVKKVEVTRTVGSGFTVERASDGGVFVVVSYSIANESKETATVITDDFRIVDAQAREFHPASNANTALALSGGGKDLILTQLQPGLKKSMQTAFEVPDDVVKGWFSLVIPEKGVFGAGKVVIMLR